MTKTDRDEERQRCREFYEKWDFIKRIVELYVEGVSWKGCKVIAPNEPEKIPSQYSHVIGDSALKDGVRDMLVDGVGNFNLKVADSTHVLPIPTPQESFLQGAEPPGRSFLWAAARNAKHLEDDVKLLGISTDAGEMVNLLVRGMCSVLGVPYELLLPDAVTANPTIIEVDLIVFRGKVDQLRKHVGFQIQEAVKPIISKALSYNGWIKIVWNEEWLLHDVECGQVYQVFKAQGIELRTLAEQTLEHAKLLYDMHAISKAEYEKYVKWFIK
jgi:hypothetical protein